MFLFFLWSVSYVCTTFGSSHAQLSCLPPPHSCQPFPRSLPTSIVLFCDPLSLMGLELTLEPTGLTTEDNDCPSRILQSSREGRGPVSPLHIPVYFLHAGHLRESPLLCVGPKSSRLVTTPESAPALSGVPSAVPVYSAVHEFILYRS